MNKINSRDKGKRGELELVAYLKEEHGYAEARRGQQFKGGTDSPDVVGVPGLHFECKRVEALSVYAAFAQACRDSGPASIPVVAHRRNGKPWLAILGLDAFMLIWRELELLRILHGDCVPELPEKW